MGRGNGVSEGTGESCTRKSRDSFSESRMGVIPTLSKQFSRSSFSVKMLSMERNAPLYRFDYVLAWQEILRNLGQDLFTTSFLAVYDLKHGMKRTYFCWKFVLSTDHKHLKIYYHRGFRKPFSPQGVCAYPHLVVGVFDESPSSNQSLVS